MPQKIILDCDPGIDDAMAILLAASSPELNVLGVTVTHGNLPLTRTLDNALRVLGLIGSDIGVYRGADRPLVRNSISASDVHGASGLGGVATPEPKRGPSARHAVEFIIEQTRAVPGEITLVAVGPLTNVALAMRLAPDLAGSLKEIVIMGGAVGAGNRSAAAEFNILADPHAANVVFAAGVKLTMFGLDATHQAIANPARVQAIRDLGTPLAATVADMLEVYKAPYQKRYGWDGAAVHDLCAVAHLIDPTIFRTQPMAAVVDIGEGPNFGRTVCDPYRRDASWPVVDVAMHVDADRLFQLLTRRIASL